MKGDHDAAAVKLVQGIADLAAQSGVRVALYGHANFYVENGPTRRESRPRRTAPISAPASTCATSS